MFTDLLDSAAPGGARGSLAAALRRGGIGRDITRDELKALIRGIADAQELSGQGRLESNGRLPSNSGFEDAVVRGSLALLSPRHPVVLPGIEPTLRLSYLKDAAEAGPDAVPVDALFVLLTPSATVHQELAAELLELFDEPSFLALVADRTSVERLTDSIVRNEPAEL